MNLTILKIDKPVYMGKFERVSIPAVEGAMEILPGHVPFMSAIQEGKISWVVDGKKEEIGVKKGFVEVNKLEVLIVL